MPASLPHALSLEAELEPLCRSGLLLLIDFDGTLAPIVSRPQDARLPDDTRELLLALAARHPLAVVSGRALEDVAAMVGIEAIYYAGSHGLTMRGPGFEHEEPAARLAEAQLTELGGELEAAVGGIRGVVIEAKPWAYAVHYRHADAIEVDEIDARVASRVAAHPALKMHHGKMVIDVTPRGGHKGLAVQRVRRLFPEAFAIYLGDDTTDEDGFAAVAGLGLGVVVATEPRPTRATAFVRDPQEVRQLLALLLRLSR